MAELERNGEITREGYWDSELTQHFRTAVQRGLVSDLTGDESTKKARELAPAIVDGERD